MAAVQRVVAEARPAGSGAVRRHDGCRHRLCDEWRAAVGGYAGATDLRHHAARRNATAPHADAVPGRAAGVVGRSYVAELDEERHRVCALFVHMLYADTLTSPRRAWGWRCKSFPDGGKALHPPDMAEYVRMVGAAAEAAEGRNVMRLPPPGPDGVAHVTARQLREALSGVDSELVAYLPHPIVVDGREGMSAAERHEAKHYCQYAQQHPKRVFVGDQNPYDVTVPQRHPNAMLP